MISIRTKINLYISLLVVLVVSLSSLVFYNYEKGAHIEALKKLGQSLVMLLARDGQVKLALSHSQDVILDAPIKMVRTFDTEGEIGYWRISNVTNTVMVEGKSSWIDLNIKDIPARKEHLESEDPVVKVIHISSSGTYYDFSIPVFEKQILAEEEFAAQYFGDNQVKRKREILGIVQIGLSTHRMNKKINEMILYIIIPMGVIIIFCGVFITFFLADHITSPLKRLASITLDIAKGDFTQILDINTRDEIGLLSRNFNQMTRDLKETNHNLRQEITKNKEIADALRTSEGKYRMLLENLPQRIFYKDENSVYISCNNNYANDLKIIPEKIEGMTDYNFYPDELAKKYREDDQRVLKSGQAEEIEEKYIIDDNEFIILTVKTPIKNESNDTIGILGIFWDITEKKALQLETIRTKQLASLGELAAGIAHEVNNPINGIINCAQILYNKSKAEREKQEIAKRIITEGERISNIVASLLSFARHGDIKVRKDDTHIHLIISETLILMKAQLKKDGINLKLDVPQDLPRIIVNQQQIQQVFLNLISNARYALNKKYPKKHINKILEIIGEEATINNSRCIKITIFDHGTGIPDKIKGEVMEPFFTIKPQGKGTGLGMSISHGILNDHGGKLLIESEEEKFTKVIIILPVA